MDGDGIPILLLRAKFEAFNHSASRGLNRSVLSLRSLITVLKPDIVVVIVLPTHEDDTRIKRQTVVVVRLG